MAAVSSLEAFGSEDGPLVETATDSRTGAPVPWRLVITAVCVLAAAGAGAYWLFKIRPAQLAAAPASLTIESEPSGLEVLSAGVVKGRTPLTFAVAPGEHKFELARGSERQPLLTIVRAGSTVVHHVKFENVASSAASTGALIVVTEPARLRVSVDGVPRGVAPVTVASLPAGSHKIEVRSPTGVLNRTVDIATGQTASVIVTAPGGVAGAGTAAGWLTVTSPVTLQLLEEGQVIGTSDAARLMLPAARHTIQLVSQSLGYSESRVVQVSAGATATLRVTLPRAPVSLNALPWADTWIDGTAVGQTPIGNHLVTIGPHEVVFRHPELGERRQNITVTLSSPARVSVDMRRPKS